MRPARRWVILRLVVIVIAIMAIAVWAYYPPSEAPQAAPAGSMPPSPDLQETRCLEAGGTWDSGNLACACPNEGETFYTFYGCMGVSPSELCEQTGGTWGPPYGELGPTGMPSACSCPEGKTFDQNQGCS